MGTWQFARATRSVGDLDPSSWPCGEGDTATKCVVGWAVPVQLRFECAQPSRSHRPLKRNQKKKEATTSEQLLRSTLFFFPEGKALWYFIELLEELHHVK